MTRVYLWRGTKQRTHSPSVNISSSHDLLFITLNPNPIHICSDPYNSLTSRNPMIIQETATPEGIPQYVRHNGSQEDTERDEEQQTHSPTMTLMSRTRQLPTTPITISSPNTVTNTHLSTSVQGRSTALSLRYLFTERDESGSGV